MRQYTLIFCLLLGMSFSAKSQISFKDSSWTWKAMLAEAKAQNKLIFMDAYAVWCGPCKWMTKNVFSVPEVGQLYNRNFVNAYIDMERGEGVALRKQYNVRYYPTYLFINGDGEVVHKVVGQTDTISFIQHGLDAISPTRNLLYLSRHAGDHTAGYLKALKNAYDLAEAGKVALASLEAQPPSTWIEAANWELINDYVKDASSAPFLYVVENEKAFAERYGQDEVAQKLYSTFLAWPINYVSYPEQGKALLDEKGFSAFMEKLEKSSYAKKDEIRAKSQLTIHYALRDWNKYAAVVNRMLSAKLIPMNIQGGDWLYGYAQNIQRFAAENKQAVKAATAWAKLLTTDIPGLNANQKVLYLDLYATLLEQKGDHDIAVDVRRSLDKEKLEAAKAGRPFQMLVKPAAPGK